MERDEQVMHFGELMMGFLDYEPNEAQMSLIAAFG